MSGNIIIIGKPGSGKSTVCKKLCASEGVSNIDIGEYLRELKSDSSTLLGRYVETFWSRNNLKEIGFEYFDKEFQKCLENKQNFVLSSPKVIDDAIEIDTHLRDQGLQVDAVIELEVDSAICLTRIQKAKPVTPPTANENESNEESEGSSYSLEDRIENSEKHIEDIRAYYKAQPHITYMSIDASKDEEEVALSIVSSMKGCERKTATYNHLPDVEVIDEGEEASDEFFERLSGCKRAELMQLMLELATNPKPKIPMTHAVPLFGGNINELGHRHYAVIRKLESTRRMILLHDNRMYAVSAQYNVFECLLPVPENMCWDGSLFDGEIVRSSVSSPDAPVVPPSIFLLDCLCAKGTSVRNEKLAGRLKYVKEFADEYKEVKAVKDDKAVDEDGKDSKEDKEKEDKKVEGSAPASIRVFAQTYYGMHQLPLLTKLGRNGVPDHPVPSARFTAEGLVFVPTTLRYNIGCSRFLLTWKPLFLNTVDLALFKELGEDGEPCLALKSYTHKEATYTTNGTISPIPKGLETIPDATVAECSISNDKWSIYKVRKERTFPNADWVVQEAIEHSKKPISSQQLLEKVQSVVRAEAQKTKKTKTNKRY